MHYSRHRLTASVIYVTTLTYESTNDQNILALLAYWSVRQKLNRVSLVQLRHSAPAISNRLSEICIIFVRT